MNTALSEDEIPQRIWIRIYPDGSLYAFVQNVTSHTNVRYDDTKPLYAYIPASALSSIWEQAITLAKDAEGDAEGDDDLHTGYRLGAGTVRRMLERAARDAVAST